MLQLFIVKRRKLILGLSWLLMLLLLLLLLALVLDSLMLNMLMLDHSLVVLGVLSILFILNKR